MKPSIGGALLGRVGKRASDLGGPLSRVFRAAAPYIVGTRALVELLTGSWILMKKIYRWVAKGGFLEVFAPARARRKQEQQRPAASGRPARRAKRAGKGSTAAAGVPDQETGEPPAWVLRFGSLVFGVYLFCYLTWSFLEWSMSLAGACWCALAWAYSPQPAARTPVAPDRLVAAETESSGEQQPSSAEEIAERFRQHVEHAVAARWAEGVRGQRQGVHVDELLLGLQQSGRVSDPRWDTQVLASYLRAIGLPVRDTLSLTVNGKKINRVGVHHDDLTAYLGWSPRLPPHLVPDLTRQESPAAPSFETGREAELQTI